MRQIVNNIRVQNKEGYKPASVESQTVRRTRDIAQLINEAANGNVEAFGEIYDIYLNRIYRYAFYHVKVKTLAEDLTEEIFMKVWKAIGTYKGDGPAFQTWVYRIAHNHITDFFRSNNKIAQLETEMSTKSYYFNDTNNPQELAEKHLMYEEILEQISLLPVNQRQIMVLKFVEGMENQEIEKITGKKQGAIRIMQMRALNTLNKQLNMT
jgi:RNA polymerase sigma-70 factor (ECF subfamily)